MLSLRIFVSVTAAAALMFACGPWGKTAQTERSTRTARAAIAAPVASAFDVRIEEGVELALTMTNNTRRAVEFEFPTGRTHDFIVLDDLGREVWRWSRDKMFTSAVRTKLVKSGGSVTYETRWDPPSLHGRYVAVATLHSTNHPVSTRVPFTLP